MANRTVWIYAIIDPRDQRVHYVGQSCNPKQRKSTLLNSVHSSSKAVIAWSMEMKAAGVKPTMILLEETTQELAGAAELKWMVMFKEAGAPLLNTHFIEMPDYRENANWWNEEKYRRNLK